MTDPAAALKGLVLDLAAHRPAPPPDFGLAEQLRLAAGCAWSLAARRAAEAAARGVAARNAGHAAWRTHAPTGMDRILQRLADGREHDCPDLRAATGLSRPGLSSALTTLERRGRIERRRLAGRTYVRLA